MIRIATQKRADAKRNVKELVDIIFTIETQHKHSQVASVFNKLLEAWGKLLALLTSQHYRTAQRSRGFFYLHANKEGRVEARMLRGLQTHAQVNRIKTKAGKTNILQEEIASEFLTFNASLYNTTQLGNAGTENAHKLERNNFLETYVAYTLQAADTAALKVPIT
ncbi:Hypothetical predicted protein, partial [Pelobates cultripes]